MGAGMVEVAGEPRGADSDKARAYYEGLSQARDRERPADHLRPVQPAQQPGRLAHHLRHHRAHRRAGRAHVRPGAQPRAERAAVVRDPAAVRQVGDVARDARAAARRAEEVRCSIPRSARRWSRSRREPYEGPTVRGTEARPPEWDWIYAHDRHEGPAQVDGRPRAPEEHPSGRADDRHGARARHEVLHGPADRQREPEPRRSS